MSTLTIAASILIAATSAVPKKGFPDMFEAHTCQYMNAAHQPATVGYQLFVPRDPGKDRYPVLVWPIFGDHLNQLVLNDLEHIEKHRFFIVVISSVDGFAEILKDIGQKHRIDESRVYLAGISRGGNWCWAMAIRYPKLFAAVVPMSAGFGEVSHAADVVNIPMWVFHNRGEKAIPSIYDERMVATVKNAGGNSILLTLLPGDSHDAWTAAFQQYDIMKWIFAQRRGTWLCWTPPGTVPWQWRHLLTEPFVFMSIVGVGWFFERRRRRRKQLIKQPRENPLNRSW